MAKTTVLTSDLTGEIVPKEKEAQIRIVVGESVSTLDVSTDDVAKLGLNGKGRTSKRAGRKADAAPATAVAANKGGAAAVQA